MDIILKYFPELSSDKIEKFKQLEALYIYWNQRINVVSRKNINELYINHVLHSLAIAKIINFKNKTNILDVGTGGGFPGIPLAILFPDCNFTLVDSIAKKIHVVDSIVNSLKLDNISTSISRVESLNTKHDFIVSRAVTNMPKFMNLTKGRVIKGGNNSLSNGIIYLKGGNLSEELKNIKNQMYNISDYFEEDFFETKKIVYVGI
ncbi:MAG: 16S rRNA (guanine(527)-N(7))-methyltransferase RsmG [Flavobacteriales bacterium]|tara:strand:+ start:1362 stop:1976 length:615 start_codon:yes stop_codon:yes gene_type:complete